MAFTAAQIAAAEAAGFLTPSGSDALKDGDDAITNNAVISHELITAATPYKGRLADGTDINAVRAAGIYSVPSITAAGTLTNWPTNRAGTLIVSHNDGASITTQDVIALVSSTAPVERYTRATLSSLNTSWSPWTSAEWVKGSANGTAEAPRNLDTYRTPGAHFISQPGTVTGLPAALAAASCLLEVFVWPTTGLAIQRVTGRLSATEVLTYQRVTGITAGWAGIEWQALGSSSNGAAVSSDPVSNHAARVEYERSRRGGGIGTAGRAVVMLRFDHWLVAFRDKVLPILQQYDLPATLNVNYDNLSNEQNGAGTIPWSEVQDWNQYHGVEIANHGATHTNASTRAAIYHEIVEGRRLLEAAMPRVPVVTWQEHGSAYLIASDIEGDIGLDLGREPRNFFESYAGKLVLAEHAIIEGKSGGFFHPLTGSPQIGQSHMSIDRDLAADTIGTIDLAVMLGSAVTIYAHPGLLDTVLVNGSIWPAAYNPDGSVDVTDPATSTSTHYATEADMRDWATANGHTVYIKTSDFEAACAHLAAERDAGRLMVMTAAGGGFADAHHDRRRNLLVKADFTEGWESWWNSASGWTVTNPGPDVVLTSSSTATRMTQGMLLHSRFGWAMGATHELVVRARSTSGAPTALLLRVEKLGDPQTWSTQKIHTVPGDGIMREYRLNLTTPRDRTITQMTVYLGGPDLEISGPPLLAAI